MTLREQLLAICDDHNERVIAISAARMALDEAAKAMDEREEYWQGRSYVQSSHEKEAECVSNMQTYSACAAAIRSIGDQLSKP